MKINIFILLLFCALFGDNSFAQQTKGLLKGRIITANNEPLADATIQFQNTTIGTKTDSEGDFSISAIPPGIYILVVSNVGYTAIKQNLNIKAGKNDLLNLQLSESKQELTEVTIGSARNSYQVKQSATSTRMDIPLLATPQSVQVVSSEVCLVLT